MKADLKSPRAHPERKAGARNGVGVDKVNASGCSAAFGRGLGLGLGLTAIRNTETWHGLNRRTSSGSSNEPQIGVRRGLAREGREPFQPDLRRIAPIERAAQVERSLCRGLALRA